MLSGRRLDLLDPSPLDVEIEDIAHGLARVARWNGQTKGDYAFSVAQHSVLVERLEIRLMALLHDAPEYVIGDLISPFKAAVGLDYKAFEAKLLTAIFLRFGLPAGMPASVRTLCKRADTISAHFEAVQLAGFSPKDARKYFGLVPKTVRPPRLTPLPAAEAQAKFLGRFRKLAQ